jgi:hypothetical protein
MANVNRFITYELPEKKTYDYIKLYEGPSQSGYFSLSSSISYTYGTKATEFTLDTETWYKIRFYDSVEDCYSPYTQSVLGGTYDTREMLAAIGNSFDGAGYAAVADFYLLTRSDATTIPSANVAKSLRIARAYIDLVTGDQTPYKFARDWSTDTTRRKYNAELELTKTGEIYLAAALCYQDLADDRTLAATLVTVSGFTGPSSLIPSGVINKDTITPSGGLTVSQDGMQFSVGSTSISMDANAISAAEYNLNKELTVAKFNQDKELTYASWNLEKDLKMLQINMTLMEATSNRYLKEAEFFNNLATRYALRADTIMNTFKPTHIPMRYGETQRAQKFLSPGDIFSFAIANVDTLITTSVLDFTIADLTGLGGSMNGVHASLESVIVDSVDGQKVFPSVNQSRLIQMVLNVNGVAYYLDDWTTYQGVTYEGKNGTTGEKQGFTLSYDTGYANDYTTIRWNFTAAEGGFNLSNTDTITLSYIVEV